MPARILVVDDSPTIRQVVATILERRGYDAEAAPDGQAAFDLLTEGGGKFDLVLLDFVMPRMNGYQFCRAVRARPELATLPIVLMSAKSDRIRDQFVQQTGAIDAISKPFDAQALVLAVENALRRVETGRASAVRLPELEEEEEHDSGRLTSPGDDRMKRARLAAEIAVKFGDVLAPALAEIPPADLRSANQIAVALTSKVTSEFLCALGMALRDLDWESGRSALAGDMGIIPIGAVLQMLTLEGQSGVLTATNGKSEITITLRGGLIDLAQSKGTSDEFRLGRYFVEEGILTKVEIERFLAQTPGEVPSLGRSPEGMLGPDRVTLVPATVADGVKANQAGDEGPPTHRVSDHPPPLITPPTPVAIAAPIPIPATSTGEVSASAPPSTLVKIDARRLLGYRLLEAGRITEEQLKNALVRQSSELAYEIMRWPRGRFDFRRKPGPPLAQAAKLGLAVSSVVMEGFRRVDEWRALDATLGNFETVLGRDDLAIRTLDTDALPRQERLVLAAIDGERTIREVIAHSSVSSFDVCRILVQFLEARIVRGLPPPAATSAPNTLVVRPA
jgi:DNA-binding response OmpR family regulator